MSAAKFAVGLLVLGGAAAMQSTRLLLPEEWVHKKATNSGFSQVNSDLSSYSFQRFVSEYRRMYDRGSKEWIKRESIFKKNLQYLIEHNAGPGSKNWVAGINKFMDFTETEFRRMLGYKGSKKSSLATSFIESRRSVEWNKTMEMVELPLTHDWRSSMLQANQFDRDQGACGSCWAIAAVQALEGHLEIKQKSSAQLSTQSLVSCVQNPRHCGGTGGCQGATAEMAFEYIAENGIPSEAHWPYLSFSGSDGVCNPLKQKLQHVKIESFSVLPENQGQPLLQALYQKGPVVMSVDGSSWSFYSSGIFSGCGKDAIINHAVVAQGFGEEKADGVNKKYFLIKNSWGKDWGENGYIRLERFDDDNAYCGIDTKPEEGTGCDGGPPTVRVCGMCGSLYDSVYPEGVSYVSLAEGGTSTQDIQKVPEKLFATAKSTAEGLSGAAQAMQLQAKQAGSLVNGAAKQGTEMMTALETGVQSEMLKAKQDAENEMLKVKQGVEGEFWKQKGTAEAKAAEAKAALEAKARWAAEAGLNGATHAAAQSLNTIFRR